MRAFPTRRVLGAAVLLAVTVMLLAFSPVSALASVTSNTLRSVAFTSSTVGYAAGANGTILKTTDGGATWSQVWSGGGAYDLRGVGANGSWAWAVDNAGALVRSVNTGGAWQVILDDVGMFNLHDATLNAVDGVAGSTVMPSGTDAVVETPPAVWVSYDGGNSFGWNDVFLAGDHEPPLDQEPWPKLGLGDFYGVDLVSASRGWAVGHDRFDSTPYANPPALNDGVIWDFDTSRPQSSYGPWQKQATFTGSGPIYGVKFADTNWGIAVGAGGKAYYTRNGGALWTAVTTPVTTNLRGVALSTTMGRAWAVGDGGVILQTTDYGATWTQLTSPTTSALYGVACTGATNVVAVGAGGAIARTTNGTSWLLLGASPTVTSIASSTHPVESSWYPSRNPAVSWTGSSATGYSYSFDKVASTVPDTASEGSGTSTSLAADSDGIWYFHIRATDGSTWSATTHRAFRIDATKPTITHNAVPAYTTSASITLTGADTGGSGVAQIKYTLDGGSEVTVSGSSAPVTAGVGAHTLVARSYDGAGNASDQTTANFTVYNPATIASLSSSTHPSSTAWYPARAATFSWTGSSATGYSYALDQASTTVPDTTQDTAGTSASVTAPSDGVWWFHVRGVNGAGVWGTAAHFKIQVDATKPTLSHNAVSDYTATASISLTAADTGGSGVAQIKYTLDSGSEVTAPGASTTVSTSDPGDHTLTARSFDGAGNVSNTSTIQFAVHEAIVPTITGVFSDNNPSASGWYKDRILDVWWTAQSSTGYSYTFDKVEGTEPDTTQETDGTSATLSADSDGVWYFHIKATDGAQWSDPYPAYAFQIDATKPTITNNAVSAYTSSASITLTGADTGGSGVAQIKYALDGGSEVVVSGSSKTVTTSVAGPHTLVAHSYDGARNESDQATVNFTVNPAPATDTFVPIAGTDRYGTCVKIAQEAYPAGASTVVVATGENWPDALGGAALAKAYSGPILLVKKDAVPSAIKTEIGRLKAKTAIILGGTGSVSRAVETGLKSAGITTIKRFGGANRYATSRLVAAEVARKMGTAFPKRAFVATGKNFADALAGSPISAAFGWPIYLVGDTVTSTDINAMKAIGARDVVILGGTGVVPSAVQTSLNSAVGASRLSGSNRYATAVKVASYGVNTLHLSWDKLALATGDNFPDALAGGVLQGKDGSVMLLTPGSKLDGGVNTVLTTNKATIHEVRYLGGLLTLTQSVRNAVAAALR